MNFNPKTLKEIRLVTRVYWLKLEIWKLWKDYPGVKTTFRNSLKTTEIIKKHCLLNNTVKQSWELSLSQDQSILTLGYKLIVKSEVAKMETRTNKVKRTNKEEIV